MVQLDFIIQHHTEFLIDDVTPHQWTKGKFGLSLVVFLVFVSWVFVFLQLDVLQLSDQAVPLAGSFTNSDTPGLPPRLHVEYDALERFVCISFTLLKQTGGRQEEPGYFSAKLLLIHCFIVGDRPPPGGPAVPPGRSLTPTPLRSSATEANKTCWGSVPPPCGRPSPRARLWRTRHCWRLSCSLPLQ